MKKRVISLLISIMLLAATAASCAPSVEPKTSGLGLSMNTFQEHDGCIYYVDFSVGKLWRAGAGGEEKMQLCDDPVNFFSIYEDRIYYTSGSEGILCSIQTDGSDKKIITDSEDKATNALKMDVADGWIYVLNHNKKLYRIKTDGTEHIALIQNAEWIYDFCIDGEWIYFLLVNQYTTLGSAQLWRMRKDGTQRQQLMQQVGHAIDYNKNSIYYTDTESGRIYSSLIRGREGQEIAADARSRFLKVIGDWVYYVDRGNDPGICRAKNDGSKRVFITYTNAFRYTVWDNWLLCYGLERVDLIRVGNSYGTDDIILDIVSEWPNVEIHDELPAGESPAASTARPPAEEAKPAEYTSPPMYPLETSNLGLAALCYQVHDGWVYYSGILGGKIYKIRPNGKEKAEIDDLAAYNFVVYDDRIYYSTAGNALYSCNTDGGDKTFLSVISGSPFEVAGGWIYFRQGNYDLYKVKTDGSELTHLMDKVWDFSVDEEWIYYTDIEFKEEYEVFFNLYRIRTDGTQKEKLTEKSCSAVDYNSGWIYYIDGPGTSVHRVRPDGSDNQKLIDCNSYNRSFFKVIGDWVYFMNGGDKPGLYKVKTDGSGRTMINNDLPDSRTVSILDIWLVYINYYSDRLNISMVRIGESHDTDTLVEEILKNMLKDFEVRKYE
jgi:hypothetical protein